MLIVLHDHEPVAVPLVVALSDSHAVELDNVAMFSALVHHFDFLVKQFCNFGRCMLGVDETL